MVGIRAWAKSTWNLGQALVGVLSFVLLLLGVVDLIKSGHHAVNFWLVLGLICLEVATLMWGIRRGRGDASRAGHHLHLPPLAGEDETVEAMATEDGFKVTRRAVKRSEEPPSDRPGHNR
jgi:hypothetical protein